MYVYVCLKPGIRVVAGMSYRHFQDMPNIMEVDCSAEGLTDSTYDVLSLSMYDPSTGVVMYNLACLFTHLSHHNITGIVHPYMSCHTSIPSQHWYCTSLHV